MDSAAWITRLDRAVTLNSGRLAVHLIYDRPDRETERPGLWRTHFAARCVSDSALDSMLDVLRDTGIYAELFTGERPFIDALASGRLERLGRDLHLAFNGIGWGIGAEGFMPGRKALVPLLADAYGIVPLNADGYGSALTVHKFHSFLVLRALGIRTPQTWGFHPTLGWVGPRPELGTKVIAKSTYEASSVGVATNSVFEVDGHSDAYLRAMAESIGQLLTVQAFIPGREVCVPVLSSSHSIVLPPVEAVIPRDPSPDGIMTLSDTLNRDGYVHRAYDGQGAEVTAMATTALQAYRYLELRGLARFDFRVDASGAPWLFDVAIEPGLSQGGSAFRSFGLLDVDYATFLRATIGASLVDWGALVAPGSP